MNFSVKSSIYNIMLGYLQPFEFAVVTDNHTNESYINAAECGSIDYLTKYKHVCLNFDDALDASSKAGQLDAIRLLVGFGSTSKKAMRSAAENGQLESINLLSSLGITDFNIALTGAAKFGQLECIRLLVKLGAPFDMHNFTLNGAVAIALKYEQFESVHLLVNLGATNLHDTLFWAIAFEQRSENIIQLIKMGAKDTDGKALRAAKLAERFDLIDPLKNSNKSI